MKKVRRYVILITLPASTPCMMQNFGLKAIQIFISRRQLLWGWESRLPEQLSPPCRAFLANSKQESPGMNSVYHFNSVGGNLAVCKFHTMDHSILFNGQKKYSPLYIFIILTICTFRYKLFFHVSNVPCDELYFHLMTMERILKKKDIFIAKVFKAENGPLIVLIVNHI
jgi:hypothetical protein